MSLCEYEIRMKGRGEPSTREEKVSTREEGRLSCTPCWEPVAAPPPICVEATEALCEWPSLPHLGVTMVSSQKWLRRGDSAEVIPLINDG